MATCSSCVSNYQTCVTNNPYDWQSCLNTYNSCLGGCNWNKAEPKAMNNRAAPQAMATCSSCVNTYQSCVTNNPYDW